jgi:hypothetical protein
MKTGVMLGSLLLSVVVFAASASGQTYVGVSAQGAPTDLRATLTLDGSGLRRTLTIVEYAAKSGGLVRSYGVDMTKRIHLIVVSDDLTTFLHLHPTLQNDGRFQLAVRFPRADLYHLYADTVPRGFGHRVFRFDVNVESSGHLKSRSAGPARDSGSVGPYTVKLSTTQVPAREDVPVLISITKSGEPAIDLHPYLGAYAHVVAVGVTDLSYTHLHAMDAARAMNMDMGNEGGVDQTAALPADTIVPSTMTVHVTLPHRGLFKVWIQFAGGGTVYAIPFVLTAQ